MDNDHFTECLNITLKWEGGYSNHPDDPGGATMRGVIQVEYDKWRKKHGLPLRPVRQIEENELQDIYRGNYWEVMHCGTLEPGMNLCVFDAAVNSGVGRAKIWLERSKNNNIDGYCGDRLSFLKSLTRLWPIFGQGWERRVNGIRASAHVMANNPVLPSDGSLHAGMRGESIKIMQNRLKVAGYDSGPTDGIFGNRTHNAVISFQRAKGLVDPAGIWLERYNNL